MLSKPILTKFSVCGKAMTVTKLQCSSCHTTIEGRFEACRCCRLSREQRQFIEVFMTSRGNIKEVERLLGISYPTVRSRLDIALVAVGDRVEREQDLRRKDIIEALDMGEITSQEAIKLQQG